MRTRHVGSTTGAALALLASVTVSALTPAPASAGVPPSNFDVDLTADAVDSNTSVGQRSLREAIGLANAANSPFGSNIVLDAGQTYTLNLCAAGGDEDANVSGDLDITAGNTVTLLGNGATIRQTCSTQRVVHGLSSGTLALDHVRLTGGNSASGGGGARSASDLRATNFSRIDHNSSTTFGGGLYAIDDLSIGFGTVIENNEAAASGGARGNDQTNILEATVRNNSSPAGVNGGLGSSGSLFVTRSTIEGNRSAGNGGGLYASANLEIDDSTVSGNHGGDDGTGEGGGMWAGGTTEVISSTVVANRAPTGANIRSDGALTLDSSIIALGSESPDCSLGSTLTNLGSTLGSDNCHNGSPPAGEPVHPMVAPLADNGGFTPTHRTVAPSPALETYNGPCDTSHDQRFTLRPQGPQCDSGSVEAVPQACTVVFPDVGAASTFFDEICWLSQMGITGGFGDGSFRPAQAVTRQSMAAFLYRLALSPPFDDPATPSFTDVAATSDFFTEIEWLSAQEIAGGFPDGTYRPGQAVSRQAMAAFLFRVAGEPPPAGPPSQTFDDVPLAHTFYEEIEWMADSGVSTGFGDGTFRPGQAVTRQAMAAFLLKLAADVPLDGL
jgi:predicted outer membrane repeat protein